MSFLKTFILSILLFCIQSPAAGEEESKYDYSGVDLSKLEYREITVEEHERMTSQGEEKEYDFSGLDFSNLVSTKDYCRNNPEDLEICDGISGESDSFIDNWGVTNLVEIFEAADKKTQKFVTFLAIYTVLPIFALWLFFPFSRKLGSLLRLDVEVGWYFHAVFFGVLSLVTCLVNDYGEGINRLFRTPEQEMFDMAIITLAPASLLFFYGKFHDFGKALPRKAYAGLICLGANLWLPFQEVVAGAYLIFFLLPLILIGLSLVDERGEGRVGPF